MRNGRPAQIVLAAFNNPKSASNALDWLLGQGFKPAGFSVIAAESVKRELTEQAPSGELSTLLAAISKTPGLDTSDRSIVGAGAIAELLEPSDRGSAEGLPAVLREIGVPPNKTTALENVVNDSGLLVAAATEDTRRADIAEALMLKANAVEAVAVDVPDSDDRP